MKNKEVRLLWCTAGTAAAVFLLPLDMGWVFLFVTLTGVFATSFAPGVYAIIPLMVKHQMLALAYGLITTLNAIGMFIGPYLTGLIRDTTGSYQYSYWFLALFFLLATLLVIVIMVIRVRGQKQSPG